MKAILNNHNNLTNNMNLYEPSDREQQPIIEMNKHPCPFTNEEAENLAGMVANRRALFEKDKNINNSRF